MNLYLQGLTLSLMGLIVTFASLGLFILIIVLLQRIFSPASPAETGVDRPHPTAGAASLPGGGTNDAQRVAAIAVAVALAGERDLPGGLGAALTEGPGRWWGQQDDLPSAQEPRPRGWRNP